MTAREPKGASHEAGVEAPSFADRDGNSLYLPRVLTGEVGAKVRAAALTPEARGEQDGLGAHELSHETTVAGDGTNVRRLTSLARELTAELAHAPERRREPLLLAHEQSMGVHRLPEPREHACPEALAGTPGLKLP